MEKKTRVRLSMPDEAAERLFKAWQEQDPALLDAFREAGFPLVDIQPVEPTPLDAVEFREDGKE